MEINQSFVVARSPEDVWEFFQDIPAVAACLPGAELEDSLGDDRYAGSLEARLGPIKAKFVGEASVSSDPDKLAGKVEGEGVDRRGGSRGAVSVDYQLAPDGPNTAVKITADISLSGTAAQFGRSGLIEELSTQIISEFVRCLEVKLIAGEDASIVQSGPASPSLGLLLLRGLWAWFKGLFRRSNEDEPRP